MSVPSRNFYMGSASGSIKLGTKGSVSSGFAYAISLPWRICCPPSPAPTRTSIRAIKSTLILAFCKAYPF